MTLDKYSKSLKPFLRKSKKKKNLSCKCPLPVFRFKPKPCCTSSSLYRALASNFVALRFMVAKSSEGVHSYVRKPGHT